MKNGTSQAVLVTDLFISDGPYLWVADDFVAQRCSECRRPVDDAVRFELGGYLCSTCLAPALL